MTPEERRLREDFASQWAENRDGMIADYRARFGKVINADNARELFAPYREGDNATRGRLTDVTSGIAQEIAQAVFRQVLAEAPQGSRVRFTAGGPGSGKSIAVEGEQGAIVFDSTFSTPEKAREMVRTALNAGHKVRIAFIYQPLEAAVRNIVTRAVEQGRIAEIGGSAERHQVAVQTVRNVAKEFGRRVTVQGFDNTHFGMHAMSPEEFAALPVLPVDAARRRGYPSLRDEFTRNAADPRYTEELLGLLGGGVEEHA